MPISKLKQARQKSLAIAHARNPNNNKSVNSTDTNISLDTAMIESDLEVSETNESDVTPDSLPEQPNCNETDFDETPENLSSSAESESWSDQDYIPSTDKTMIIGYKFLLNLMQLVCCPGCHKLGGLVPSVTYLCGFFLEINFLCRCKYSFGLANFPDTDINAVFIRNLISNGIPKQAFQRWLQVGNFGAEVHGESRSINLFTAASTRTYKEQNDVIIEGAEKIHKAEVERLVQANKPIIISTDMCYAKRGYHSPAGHAAIICKDSETGEAKVIDARTVKRSSKPSKNAYGEIVDLPANKMEQHAVKRMIKDLIPEIGPMIKQIDVDQDAAIQTVLTDMKWEAEDVQRINKFNGLPVCSPEQVGKSVWDGQIPEIHFDKVRIRNFDKKYCKTGHNGQFGAPNSPF